MPNEIWLLLFEYNTTFHGIKLYENIADCPWNSLVKKKRKLRVLLLLMELYRQKNTLDFTPVN